MKNTIKGRLDKDGTSRGVMTFREGYGGNHHIQVTDGSVGAVIATLTGASMGPFWRKFIEPQDEMVARLKDEEEGKANAKRFVACWNAFKGIPTEALESGVVGEMVKALKGIRELIIADKCELISGQAIADILAKLEGK